MFTTSFWQWFESLPWQDLWLLLFPFAFRNHQLMYSMCTNLLKPTNRVKSVFISILSIRKHKLLLLLRTRAKFYCQWFLFCNLPLSPPYSTSKGLGQTETGWVFVYCKGGGGWWIPSGDSEKYTMVFILQFVNVVYYIDWFLDIEKYLYPWDKSHLISVYDLSNILLDSVY